MTELTIWTVGPDEDWPNNKTFGERLALWRQLKNFSRAQAAQRLNLSPEYIRLIEHGLRTPAEGHMMHILDLYGIEYVYADKRWVVGNEAFEFTSRIRDRRAPDAGLPPSRPGAMGKHELLGHILERLSKADKATLLDVQNFLDSRGIHDV